MLTDLEKAREWLRRELEHYRNWGERPTSLNTVGKPPDVCDAIEQLQVLLAATEPAGSCTCGHTRILPRGNIYESDPEVLLMLTVARDVAGAKVPAAPAWLAALDAAIERFGVCECPTWHSSNAIFCRYCGRRVPHAD